MKLEQYLDRIGASGTQLRPDVPTLALLHRRHQLSVAFENLDVQLGVALSTDIEAAYDKIVRRRRGGWCYEQNGLFGWALSTVGFDVTRVAAAVRLDERGESARNNHLCLLVRAADRPDALYLADVGFGGALLEPIPLSVGEFEQAPYTVGLKKRPDGNWAFHESASGTEAYFVFAQAPGDEAAMSARCALLQSDPESSFVLNLVAQRRFERSQLTLRGRVLTTTDAINSTTRLLESADELVATLERVFQLPANDAGDLWPRIVERHSTLFTDNLIDQEDL